MKVCLAGLINVNYLEDRISDCKYVLESYYSIKNKDVSLLKNAELFLLDSGAFTFMNSKKEESVDFDSYLDGYIDFINKNDIKYFFELDIDNIVGIEKVEELRKKLEEKTNKKCIPVWHKSRGKQYFINLCKKYDYVAIGGIVTGEIKPKDYKYFRWFIDTAHSYNCKIHGLGFTNIKGMYEYNFDSVDSTNWNGGRRFGDLYTFNGVELINVKSQAKKNSKRRVKVSAEEINMHNYYEWLKFQEYADKKL